MKLPQRPTASTSGEPGTETREHTRGVNIDLDAAGAVIGLDIDRASKTLDLTTLGTAP
jgi:uncharacterized protein YuzE